MRRLLREPLLHFLVLGLVLLAGRATLAPAIQAKVHPPSVRVGAAEVERLRAQWHKQTGRAPDAETLRALIHDYVDDELLFREARRLGLQRSDPVVAQWLLRSMRFAEPDTGADAGALLKTAYAMGLADHDPVVRRRLIERMRQRIESRARVNADQLDAYLADHREDYALASRYRFKQVFFSRDKRGALARRDAAAALARLQGAQPPAPWRLGDPFQLGTRFSGMTRGDIERRFGAGFAVRVTQAPVDTWVGPLTSAYGQHLVRVEGVRAGGPPRMAAVRPRAVAMLYRQQERAQLQAALTRLRAHYRIRVDAEPAIAGARGRLP